MQRIIVLAGLAWLATTPAMAQAWGEAATGIRIGWLIGAGLTLAACAAAWARLWLAVALGLVAALWSGLMLRELYAGAFSATYWAGAGWPMLLLWHLAGGSGLLLPALAWLMSWRRLRASSKM